MRRIVIIYELPIISGINKLFQIKERKVKGNGEGREREKGTEKKERGQKRERGWD